MLRKTFSSIGILLLIASSSLDADVTWLGAYKESSIPGHEIVETDLLTPQFNNLQHEGVYQDVLEGMNSQCLKYGVGECGRDAGDG